MTEPVSVDICVCTFRRASLADALISLARMTLGDIAVRVIVADNDGVPSARTLVELLGTQMPFAVTYLHCPAANISLARNACLDAASADFLAFVDDDETVDPDWLVTLVGEAQRTGADVVLGPVEAIYDASMPDWLRSGNFHSTAPVSVRGEILTGYTCNVLLRRSARFAGFRFDLGLGKSGGEDTDYFRRLHEAGARLVAAPAALVYEPVPPSRAGLGWLLKRRLRSGQSHGMGFRGQGLTSRLKVVGLASSKVAYCATLTAVTAFSPVLWRRNLLRAALHAGVVAGVIGVRQARLYGN